MTDSSGKKKGIKDLRAHKDYSAPIESAIPMAECPTSTSKTAIVVTQSVVQSDDEDFETQNFRSRYINLVQLLTLLRAKFGIGAYEIQVSSGSSIQGFQMLTLHPS